MSPGIGKWPFRLSSLLVTVSRHLKQGMEGILAHRMDWIVNPGAENIILFLYSTLDIRVSVCENLTRCSEVGVCGPSSKIGVIDQLITGDERETRGRDACEDTLRLFTRRYWRIRRLEQDGAREASGEGVQAAENEA